MARLNARSRSNVKKSDFAIPSKAGTAAAKKKSGNYPIQDKGHAIAALGLVKKNGTPAQKTEVRKAVAKKYNIGPDAKKKGTK